MAIGLSDQPASAERPPEERIVYDAERVNRENLEIEAINGGFFVAI